MRSYRYHRQKLLVARPKVLLEVKRGKASVNYAYLPYELVEISAVSDDEEIARVFKKKRKPRSGKKK